MLSRECEAFAVAGTPIAKNAAGVEAGLDLAITTSITHGLSYSQIGDGSQ